MKNLEKSNEWIAITHNIVKLVNASEKNKSQIAKEIGIAKATLSQYISGRAFPSLVTLKQLCKVLDCEYAEILGEL